MSMQFDVLIVGSGPAGVSAAFPLLDAGKQVLMTDGGRTAQQAPPLEPYLTERASNPAQWRWMLGTDFHAIKNIGAVSPKLRAPTQAWVFDGFEKIAQMHTRNFVAAGSLAAGGLSNAWGCGVAALSSAELAAFPFPAQELTASYAAVARRIGISGGSNDDMSDYFGLDQWAQSAVPLDSLQSALFKRYNSSRAQLHNSSFRLGRSRVAVLTEARGSRLACDRSGTCLWGCARQALYSATMDLQALQRYPNFHYYPGHVVEQLGGNADCRTISGRNLQGDAFHFSGNKLLLAAGTLASTRLALQALGHTAAVPLQTSPTAAFMLWVPRALGRKHEPGFGLGQLSVACALTESITGFGTLFSTTGLPLAEFAPYLPLRKRFAVDVLSVLLSSCVAGNIFLPGSLSDNTLSVSANGLMSITGAYKPTVALHMKTAEQHLRRAFWQLGAVLLPRSFMVARPGSDLHYAATLPMQHNPGPAQTSSTGELHGLPGVHAIDGASLSVLTEKSHTLTLMANADRIGRQLGARLQ